MGSIGELWRFPVKSMQGESVSSAALGAAGMVGDRAFALLDLDTGDVAVASNRAFPALIACQASLVREPTAGEALPPARIGLPDGTSVRTDEHAVDERLSSFFGRAVRVIGSAPDSWLRSRERFLAGMGLSTPHGTGDLMDACPLSLITTATLAALRRHEPECDFDLRRFRMNICVETDEPGFVEDAWVGAELALGDAVRLEVTMRDPRCVVTTLPAPPLPRDTRILRTIARVNAQPVGTAAALPCAGVYAVVTAGGIVRVGDDVRTRAPGRPG